MNASPSLSSHLRVGPGLFRREAQPTPGVRVGVHRDRRHGLGRLGGGELVEEAVFARRAGVFDEGRLVAAERVLRFALEVDPEVARVSREVPTVAHRAAVLRVARGRHRFVLTPECRG